MSDNISVNSIYGYNAETPNLTGGKGKVKASLNEAAWGIFNSDNGVNGEIDEAVFQGQSGDCWLISGLISLSYTEEGQELIQNAITQNEDGSYQVTFEGVDKTYTITQDELESADKSSLLSGLGIVKSKYSTGDDDMLLIELAMEKLIDEGEIPIETIDGLTGGSAYYFYQIFTKNEVSYSNGEDVEEIAGLIDYYSTYQDSCAATIGVETGFAGLTDDHAYAVKSINDSYITLVNPWDTTEDIEVSIEDLASNIGNYDLSVVNNETEESSSYFEDYYA